MTWAVLYRDAYALNLTDGYLIETAERASRPEAAVADHLRGLARTVERRPTHRGPGPTARHAPVHAWVVGDGRWARTLPKAVRGIADGDRDPSYRLVILGLGVQPYGRQYLELLDRRVFGSGLFLEKLHTAPQQFTGACWPLLAAMQECYHRTGRAPTRVLTLLDLPVTFRGDDPPGRPAPGRTRDQ